MPQTITKTFPGATPIMFFRAIFIWHFALIEELLGKCVLRGDFKSHVGCASHQIRFLSRPLVESLTVKRVSFQYIPVLTHFFGWFELRLLRILRADELELHQDSEAEYDCEEGWDPLNGIIPPWFDVGVWAFFHEIINLVPADSKWESSRDSNFLYRWIEQCHHRSCSAFQSWMLTMASF